MFSSFRLQNRKSRRGVTTVEFALTAPLLFLFLIAAIEFSRANMLRHTTVAAATEGARRSIIPGATAKECETAAAREMAAVGFPAADITVEPANILADTSQVTVSVTAPMNGENGFVIPKFLKGAEINKSVTLQRETAVENPDTERAKGSGNKNGKGNGNGNGNAKGKSAAGNSNGSGKKVGHGK